MRPYKAWKHNYDQPQNLMHVAQEYWETTHFSCDVPISSSSWTTFAVTDEEAEHEFEAKVLQHFVTLVSKPKAWSVSIFFMDL